MEKFDHEAYEKAQETLVTLAREDYYHESLNIPAYQFGIIKTYLWISTFFLTIELAVFKDLLVKPYYSLPSLVAFASMALAFAVFCFGVDTLRGRGRGFLPIGDYVETQEIFYRKAAEDFCGTAIHSTLINAFNLGVKHHLADNNIVGLKLRKMSWLLLGSAALFVAALLCHYLT